MALKLSCRLLLRRGASTIAADAGSVLHSTSCLSSAASSRTLLTPCLNEANRVTCRSFAVSTLRQSLLDFFDEEANWDKDDTKTGRPWKLEELRIKSNVDLHKLWYVLLKEVNMLLTMEEEYRRVQKLFPGPDRLDKCEESMENILQVVRERNEAYNMLETGHKGEPKREWRHDILGRPFVYTHQEHLLPEHLNEEHEPNPMSYPPDNEKWLWLVRERDLREKKYWENSELKRKRKLKDIWPENEVLKEVPDPEPWKEDFTAGNQPSGAFSSD